MTSVKNPSRLLVKTAQKLFSDPAEREKFVTALTDPNPPPPHIVWLKERPGTTDQRPRTTDYGPQTTDQEPWTKNELQVTGPWSVVHGLNFFDVEVLPKDAEPGKDPLHEQGFYYCMDPSSIAALSVLAGIDFKVPGPWSVVPGPVLVDLCSATGGKGIMAWHRFSPEIALFNEVIRKRISPLIYNLKRCGVLNGVVTQMD